ncbi:MAG: LamG domain-containing protein [Planctomycetota bacterium]|jgi:hypothetical protein
MFRRHVCLTVVVLLAGLTGSASAVIVVSGVETWGSTIMNQDVHVVAGGRLTITGLFRIVNSYTLTVEEAGQVIVNARVDFDTGGTLVMNGGTAAFNDTVKFPDNDDGAVYIYLYGGHLTCGDTESYASRGSELHVGGGVMRTGQTDQPGRDPESGAWNIQPIAPYEQIIITSLGGGVKEISAARGAIEVTFASAASGNFETVTSANLIVNLSDAADQTITVDYVVTGGTATRDTDYALADGTLVFVAGDTAETISIDITNDGLDEDDETIIVTLTNPTGNDAELGQIVEHTYTIVDPRPRVQFASAASRGRESITAANLTVELSHGWPQTVTVDYTVTGGTAIRDMDYTLADDMLTFDPWQTARTIVVDIVDDELAEGNETIILALSNPTGGARLGDNAQHIFTITEQIPLLRGAFYFRSDSDGSARVGPHPDIIVRLGDGDNKLIFRRDKGYLPVWYAEDNGEQDLPTEIARSGCENTVNPFSRVFVIDTNPARAIVHWRYARDCGSVGATGWVDEYFTVYPDGVCIRTIKNAAGTSASQWSGMTPDIRTMQLLPEGIAALPAEWLNSAALSVTSGDYTYEGFNQERRCYALKCNVTCAPSVLNLTLDTTGGKSIHNPVLVLENWGDADALVTIDGNEPGLFYTGYCDDMYGDHLVVWLGLETTASTDISITPVDGSGQFVNRAPPPDFGYDFDNDIPPLPMGSPEAGPFGAYYTQLKFNNRFDELWRVGDHTDVVVQFDDKAHRFVFWRGTNYCPHWASDTSETPYSNWYGTQFVERRASEWGLDGCCAEPMQDWQCRYAHARIISSNAARAIVQWRYSSCDPHYDIPRDGSGDLWGEWTDEYYTIYPDAISVRKATAYSSRTGGADMEDPHIEYHEAIPVTNPGTVPEDNIHWNALSATNYAGNKKDWIAQDVDGGAMTDLGLIANKPIMVVRMKGSTVPVSIVEGTSVEHDPVDQHDCRPFNAYDDWPAWPESDRSMGGWLWDEDPATHCYRYFYKWYPSHCSMLHLKWKDYEHLVNQRRTKVMLYGMFDATQAANVNNLIPLARSWEYAPALTISTSGFSGGSYDKTERAYRISRDSDQATELEFTVTASPSSPVHNPCFVIENWDSEVRLTIDGQTIEQGPDFRQGIEKSADEVSSLVVWIREQSTSPINVKMLVSGIPGDLDSDQDVDEADLRLFAMHWLEENFSSEPVGRIVGWWKFDEGDGTAAYDSAGENHGALQGNPEWVAGNVGSHALDFDGDQDCVTAADSDDSLDTDDSMTITAWVRLNNLDKYYFIVTKQPSGTAPSNYPGNYGFRIQPTGGYLQLTYQTSTAQTWSSCTSTLAIVAGTWHHAAVTVTEGGDVNFYIDGLPAGTSPQSGTFGIVNDEPVRIGTRKDAYSYFDGAIDDARIFGYELNADEIMQACEGLPVEDRFICLGNPVGDLNYDCQVNSADFAVLASHWLEVYE